jgi:Zn-dependent protease with chaperone function
MLRLALLVLEGYVWLALILATFVGALALLAWGFSTRRIAIALPGVFIAIPLAAATLKAMRALFFRLPEPGGIEARREQAPALHDMVDELRRRMNVPRVHRILIGTSTNATAVQVPRLVLFWPRNVLVVGYPYLAGLPPDELRAVIAHELGHLSHAHGRFFVWIYRTRLSWLRVMHALHEHGVTPVYVAWLGRRYVARLQAHSAGIARAQEFIADRCAAGIAGTRVTADALLRTQLLAWFLDEVYWPEVQRTRAADPFTSMAAALRRARDAAAPELHELLEPGAGDHYTHPGLAERLAALGEAPRLPEPREPRAGQIYLGESLGEFAKQLDAEWLRARGAMDERDPEEAERDTRRLAELEALQSASAEEIHERARLLEELNGEDAALPVYRAAHSAGSVPAALAIGRILLDRDDEEGLTLVEQAVAADESLLVPAAGVLVPFLRERGRLVDAQRWHARAARKRTLAALAEQERASLSPLDRFRPHDVAGGAVAPLATIVGGHGAVQRAFLVRREWRYAEGGELVLALQLSGDATASAGNDIVERIRRELAAPGGHASARARAESILSADLRILMLDPGQRDLPGILLAVPAACIYSRTPDLSGSDVGAR